MEKKGVYPTVKYKGIYLHSPYNPIAEAKKILFPHKLEGKNLFIIFEPGLGYLVEALQELSPHARFILISPLDILKKELKNHSNIAIWTKGIRKESFLLDHIHESDLDSLSYIPWPPSLRILAEEARIWNSILKKVIIRLSGNHANLAGFGKKNLRNSLINYLTSSPPRIPLLEDKHVLITASGPTLQKYLPIIQEKREGYFLLALPSSVKALVSQSIIPDLILSTDGGYWSARHYEYFPHQTPVGIALSSRVDFSRQKNIFPLFQQNTLAENSFFKDISLFSLPTSGTVALSAILFCVSARAESITLAGLDLCLDDIKSHVSPHSFDSFIEEGTSRTGSLQHSYFHRAQQMTLKKEGRIRYGHSLSLYREMMKNLTGNAELYRLSAGTPHLDGWVEIDNLFPRPPQSVTWIEIPYPDRRERQKRVKESISLWKKTFLREMENSQDFFRSPPHEFFDFLYTLSAERFSQMRKLSFQEKDSAYDDHLHGMILELQDFFNKMEALCDKFS